MGYWTLENSQTLCAFSVLNKKSETTITYRHAKTGQHLICDKTSLTSVPHVVTCGPGQWALEGAAQVEDGPGQHHNVVYVQIGHNHLGRHPQPCRI